MPTQIRKGREISQVRQPSVETAASVIEERKLINNLSVRFPFPEPTKEKVALDSKAATSPT